MNLRKIKGVNVSYSHDLFSLKNIEYNFLRLMWQKQVPYFIFAREYSSSLESYSNTYYFFWGGGVTIKEVSILL